MNQKMLSTRTVLKAALSLRDALNLDNSSHALMPLLEDLISEYKIQYNNFKHTEHEPSIVYQIYGKKTSELTPDEGRAYRALLKRQRDARKRAMRDK